MARKHLVLLGVLFAAFFLISSVVAAREMAETKDVNDHVGDAKQYGGGGGGGSYGCRYGCCRYGYFRRCFRCCYYEGEVPDVETDVEPHN